MTLRFGVVVAALAGMFAAQACAQQHVIVESGHVGAANALAVDEDEGVVVSGGDDGTIRVWNESTNELEGMVHIGYLPVKMVAVNPKNHDVAAFVSDNIDVYRIVVVNWQTGAQVFSHDLAETPLFMQYAPNGDFLVYGVTEWKSLTFLDASSGSALPYFPDGFGIVSAAIVSDTGKTMMTYNPSGQLSYWNIETGTLRQSYQTLSNLQDISFSQNNRYMAGQYGNNLVVVDLVGGQTVASIPLPGLQLTAFDASSNAVAAYTTGGANGPQLSLFDVSGGLYQRALAFDTPASAVTSLSYGGGAVYASLADGSLFEQRPFFSASTFGGDNLMPVDDFAVSGDDIVLASPQSIIELSSPLMASSFLGSNPSPSITSTLDANPFVGPTDVLPLSGGRFVLWNTSGSTGAYRILEQTGALGDTIGNFPAPLLQIVNAGGNLLTLDTQGTINLVATDTGSSLFSYSSFGLNSIAYVDSNHIYAGRSGTGVINTPLLQINPTTGETVPVTDDSVVVLSLAIDPVKNLLFSLGIESTGASASTVLRGRGVPALEDSEVWSQYAGEDQGAGIAVDPSTGNLFTSLGYSAVREISSASEPPTVFDKSDHTPRKLVVSGNWLYALNTDSSITVWDARNGKRMLDLYVFKDGSWAVIPAAGQYYASSGADQYLRQVEPDQARATGSATQTPTS